MNSTQTVSSIHNRADIHTNSRKLWQHPQNTQKFNSDKILGLRSKVHTKSTPNEEVTCDSYLLGNRKSIFSNGVDITATIWSKSHATSSLTNIMLILFYFSCVLVLLGSFFLSYCLFLFIYFACCLLVCIKPCILLWMWFCFTFLIFFLRKRDLERGRGQ